MRTKADCIEAMKAAGVIQPELTIDYALPQDWLNTQADKFKHVPQAYELIRSCFVWAYDDTCCFGYPLPIVLNHFTVSVLLQQNIN